MSTKTRNLLAPIVALTLVSFTMAQPAYAGDHETQGDDTDTVSVTWHMPAPNDGTAPTWPQTLALTDTSSEWCQVDVYRNDPEAIAAIKADGLLTLNGGTPEDSGVYLSYEFVKCNPTVTPTPTPTPTPPVVTPPVTPPAPPAPPVVAPPAPPAPPVAVAPVPVVAPVAVVQAPAQRKAPVAVAKPQLAETGAASGALALLGGALALSGVCLVAVGRKLRRI